MKIVKLFIRARIYIDGKMGILRFTLMNVHFVSFSYKLMYFRAVPPSNLNL